MGAIIALTARLALHLDVVGERRALRRAVLTSQVLTCVCGGALVSFRVEIPNR
jgi:hypothetical protein